MPREGSAEWFAVSSGFYSLRSFNGELLVPLFLVAARPRVHGTRGPRRVREAKNQPGGGVLGVYSATSFFLEFSLFRKFVLGAPLKIYVKKSTTRGISSGRLLAMLAGQRPPGSTV